ncbi:MAG: hypothetical protein ACYC2U_07000 [Candidatus Amoebophilus sp.]
MSIIKKVSTNVDGSQGGLYLGTNDLEKDATYIYQTYQKRWCIEEYHKSTKLNASLEKSPAKVERSQRNHIFAFIVAYCELELLSIKFTSIILPSSINYFSKLISLLLRNFKK